jgi:hypothetical protein
MVVDVFFLPSVFLLFLLLEEVDALDAAGCFFLTDCTTTSSSEEESSSSSEPPAQNSAMVIILGAGAGPSSKDSTAKIVNKPVSSSRSSMARAAATEETEAPSSLSVDAMVKSARVINAWKAVGFPWSEKKKLRSCEIKRDTVLLCSLEQFHEKSELPELSSSISAWSLRSNHIFFLLVHT